MSDVDYAGCPETVTFIGSEASVAYVVRLSVWGPCWSRPEESMSPGNWIYVYIDTGSGCTPDLVHGRKGFLLPFLLTLDEGPSIYSCASCLGEANRLRFKRIGIGEQDIEQEWPELSRY